ncbi:relaxase [Bacteroides cellulosilyticus]|uniref:relaxase n=1 Tax=Bacteroides cellulosilyticus TaxID=246787 RepID=UPI0022E0CE51|nr:relaxase [Bacteroides cellulosilyticus]
MIANAKSISHGIRAMLYVSGESRNKKHPEKITRVCDNFMPQGMDASGIWTEMKFVTMDRPDIKNKVIRLEISPAIEHTEDFTVEDWQQLWNDFAAAYDDQTILDKDGKVISVPTNISGSKSSVWLHRESDSGIPHLHAVVCRIDENGNINNDHAIHIRAHRAAEKIALQRGWITAKHIHESRIPQVSEDCMEALRELDEWSWEGYIERLATKGYTLYPRKDDEGIIRGYVLHKGSSRFKGSELGKGRNLTASRIERTWEKLHPGQTKQESPATKQPVVTTAKPPVHNEAGQKTQTKAGRNNPVYEYYTAWQSDRLRTEFEYNGKNYDRYIPEKVLDCLNDELNHRELKNWQPLQNLAIAFFTLVASPYGEVSGGGGGGSQSDLKWGRDPEEDEIEFMRRCAREASHRLGLQKKSGMKRK